MIHSRRRVVVIGEGMLELVRKGETWQLSYGGDTLNTAIHLARAGHDVAYLTALGTDPLSAGFAANGLRDRAGHRSGWGNVTLAARLQSGAMT